MKYLTIALTILTGCAIPTLDFQDRKNIEVKRCIDRLAKNRDNKLTAEETCKW